MKLYYNPNCSKSRQTKTLLEEKQIDFEVIEYLKQTPTTEELKNICKKLNISPIELIRTNEDKFKTLLKENGIPSDTQAIEWMNKFPNIIQRPILVTDTKAVLGRPPEEILKII